jgi:uncharacterized protein DUF6941
MNVFAGLIAREAKYHADGTFDVIGAGINSLAIPTLPAAVKLALVIRLQLDQAEADRIHYLSLRLIGPSGVDTMPLVRVPLVARKATAPRHFMNIVTDVTALFPEPGDYQFQVTVDGDALPFIHLAVMRMDNPLTSP